MESLPLPLQVLAAEVGRVQHADIARGDAAALARAMGQQKEILPEREGRARFFLHASLFGWVFFFQFCLHTRVFLHPICSFPESSQRYCHCHSPVQAGDRVVDDRPRRRGRELLRREGVEVGADLFLHHHDHHAGVVVLKSVEALLHLRDLVLEHGVELAVRHAIPVHDYLLGQTVVHLGKQKLEELAVFSP